MRAIGKIFKWLFITLFTFLVIGILTAFIFGSLFLSYVKNDIMTSDETILNLETMPVNLSSTIYYKDPETGAYTEWVTLQNTENREWVSNEDIPEKFKNLSKKRKELKKLFSIIIHKRNNLFIMTKY